MVAEGGGGDQLTSLEGDQLTSLKEGGGGAPSSSSANGQGKEAAAVVRD
jgi:hypothetical protein